MKWLVLTHRAGLAQPVTPPPLSTAHAEPPTKEMFLLQSQKEAASCPQFTFFSTLADSLFPWYKYSDDSDTVLLHITSNIDKLISESEIRNKTEEP